MENAPENREVPTREWWFDVEGYEKAGQLINLLFNARAIKISAEHFNLITDQDFRQGILKEAQKVVEAIESDPGMNTRGIGSLKASLAELINKRLTEMHIETKVDTDFLRKKKQGLQ